MKTATSLDPDRATDVPGGVVTSCVWKSGSKTVSVASAGAGTGGASIWDARTLYDAETGRAPGRSSRSTSRTPSRDAASGGR